MRILMDSVLIVVIVGWLGIAACAGIIAWTFLENYLARDKPCVLLWRQGNSTTQATGALKRDGRGRAVCEVVR